MVTNVSSPPPSLCGPDGMVPFPFFKIERAEGESDEDTIERVEAQATEILCPYSDKEYAARIAVAR